MPIGRFSLCILVALALTQPAYAQEDEAEEPAGLVDEVADVAPTEEPEAVAAAPEIPAAPSFLLEENAGRARANRIGAFVLGGWALGNFGWATVGLLGEPDDRESAFHLTNAAINLVVAGVAVTTYFSNQPDDEWANYDAVRTLNEAHNTEKLYLLSTGLDFAYIATGAYLTAKGNLDGKEGIVGTGRSLMLQGAFLAAFDIAMFTFHALRRTKFVAQLIGPSE